VPVFVGTHINKVDRKGRVSVPAPFRNGLAGQSTQGVYVMRSIRGVQALDGFAPDSFADLANSISNPFASEHEDVTSAIFGAAMLLPFDGEGRMVIPDHLRDFAGLGEQACFIGRGPFFQIWEPEAGQRHQEEAFRRATENRDSIQLAFASKMGGGDGR
jgi:MraZ protein